MDYRLEPDEKKRASEILELIRKTIEEAKLEDLQKLVDDLWLVEKESGRLREMLKKKLER